MKYIYIGEELNAESCMRDLKRIDRCSLDELEEVKINRISNSGTAIAEKDGSRIHVKRNSILDIELVPDEKHVVEIKESGSLLYGIVTGFRTLEDLKNFDLPEDLSAWKDSIEWNTSPEPGQYFQGTIDRVNDSGERVVNLNSKFMKSIVVDMGNPGDEVGIRLTKKSGDDLIGRVIGYLHKEPEEYELSNAEKRVANDKFDTVDYRSNMNDLLNTDS